MIVETRRGCPWSLMSGQSRISKEMSPDMEIKFMTRFMPCELLEAQSMFVLNKNGTF